MFEKIIGAVYCFFGFHDRKGCRCVRCGKSIHDLKFVALGIVSYSDCGLCGRADDWQDFGCVLYCSNVGEDDTTSTNASAAKK